MIDRSHSAPLAGHHTAAERTAIPGLSRLASLALALVMLLTLAIFPDVTRRGDELMTQAVMPLLLVGVCACVMHGLGWRPRNSILAAAAGPLVAWPVPLAAFAFLAFGA